MTDTTATICFRRFYEHKENPARIEQWDKLGERRPPVSLNACCIQSIKSLLNPGRRRVGGKEQVYQKGGLRWHRQVAKPSKAYLPTMVLWIKQVCQRKGSSMLDTIGLKRFGQCLSMSCQRRVTNIEQVVHNT